MEAIGPTMDIGITATQIMGTETTAIGITGTRTTDIGIMGTETTDIGTTGMGIADTGITDTSITRAGTMGVTAMATMARCSVHISAAIKKPVTPTAVATGAKIIINFGLESARL